MKFIKRIVLLVIIGVLVPGPLGVARPDPGLILTVGPGGAHPAIQAAINAALGSLNSSPIEIRVATGNYAENINIPAAMDHGSVTLSGGWNANFSSRDLNPTLTTINGGAQGRVFLIASSGGELTFDGFTITNGGTLGFGGGLYITLTGDAKVTVNNSHIRNNTATGQAPSLAGGGGIFSFLQANTRLFITNNIITDNRCDGGSTTEAWGAGMWLDVDQDALFTIRNNRIENNNTITGNGSNGAGVFIRTFNGGSGEFSDNLIRNNSAAGPTTGAAGALWMNGTGRINARRNAWVDNVINFPAEDVSLISADTTTLLFTDSIIAGAKSIGVGVDARDSSAIHLTNLTIADNQNRGLFVRSDSDDTGTKTLYNSILYNNGVSTNLNGVNAGNNLIGVDPRWVNSAGRDYHLLVTSPAINGGDNNPPGTLGPMDLDQHARITGGTVDIGAYEMGEPDFSLSFDQATVDGTLGTKVKVRININRFGGFTGNVTVTPPDLSAIRVIPKPPDPISTTDSSVSFKLKIKGGAPTGPHQITFTGRDDSGRERTATVRLVIQ